ncbi:MAG: hypothetical protein R2748_16925 [Bryobacterales bacterium]
MLAAVAPALAHRVQVAEPAEWQSLLSAVGLEAVAEPSAFRIVVGDSEPARAAGFAPTLEKVRVASLADVRDSDLEIFWEKPLELPVFSLPEGARVFTREARSGAPLVAGLYRNGGAVLWTATAPGKGGIERYPYLIHALADLGAELPFRNDSTWAFLDYSYRLRADPAYLARRWSEAGIAGLQVSGWHFFEPDPARDAWLETLLAACRREGIVVYVWLELPHVSEAFWQNNPDCREKTALQQDAQLDWRKLVDLVGTSLRRARRAGPRVAAHALPLGRRERGRALFRVATRTVGPVTLHSAERGGARARSSPTRVRSLGAVR